MTNHTEIQHVATISELHRNLELAKPLHPLVSLIRLDDLDFSKYVELVRFSYGFYTVSLKRGIQNKVHYGHRSYDFDEGVLALVKPHQVMAMQAHPDDDITGWMLAFHPDFLSGYPLSEKIRKYGFFSYEVDEALHLSDREEQLLLTLMQQLYQEYSDRIDAFSQDVMISQLDLLLSHVNRFYNRQFLTRKKSNANILSKLDAFLEDYFDSGRAYSDGFPSVVQLAKYLSVSTSYLNDMLTSLTGSSARDYIQRLVVRKAKLSLSLTVKSVSEIGYALGFQHSQSFSKFFKKHTNLSPSEYRKSVH
ncbi:HTH-type transcriptional activator RhaS [Pseudovibrio sp. Ad46]|uniref:helix-turn-helix domain-containing protein n=1 Tax=unclassified Pseudovibrio TaxID=2627060 RepID=UPI0007AE6D8B|nr:MULTISPECIES: AraC family transcriptional regulator [unclassified Pseudovibrio]KZK93623.1 HTH-type transcriptional activator RhaS [Pseudovibrio sp. Ad46]KZK95839.1 HTH-type transcriptional activator RhaS [Pseudovibrio sp. Ad5]